MGFFDTINQGFDFANKVGTEGSNNFINTLNPLNSVLLKGGILQDKPKGRLIKTDNKADNDMLRKYLVKKYLPFAKGGTIAEGPVLRRPTHHGMSGPTSFQPHYTGMAHSVKPVGQSFAQASFIQGGYFPGADHSLI